MKQHTPEALACLQISALIRSEVPKYKDVLKPDWLMPGVTTTLYPNIYWSRHVYSDPAKMWKILAHEYMHMRQAKALGPVRFLLAYAFPQIGAVFSLLALFAIWGSGAWLWALAALALLLPWPAYWRMKYEVEGYTMSMAVNYWRYGFVTEDQLDWTAGVFRSSTYYFMWPFPMKKKLEKIMDDIHRDLYDYRPGYAEIKKIVEDLWRPNR